MPITYTYEKPQVKVYQTFTEVPTTVVGDQPVFVFGPSFQLYRYGEESEREYTQLFNASGAEAAFAGAKLENLAYPRTDNADIGWAKAGLFVENAVVNIGNVTLLAADMTGSSALPIDTSVYTVDKTGTFLYVKAVNGECPVEVGDMIKVGNDYVSIAGVYPRNSAVSTSSVQAAYKYVISLGSTIDTSAYTGTEAAAYSFYDSLEVPEELDGTNWTATASAITVNASVKVPVRTVATNGNAILVSAERLYFQYRYPVYTESTAIAHIEQLGDIAGQIDPDNPLSFGIYQAKLNAGGCPVYYIATKGVRPSDYKDALDKATLTDDIYQIVPVFTSESVAGDHHGILQEVFDLVQAHVDAMSQPEAKRWRIGWVSAKYATETEVLKGGYNVKLHEVGGVKVLDFVTSASGNPVDLTVEARSLISPGDYIYLNVPYDGSTVETRFTVYDVVTDQRIKLTDYTGLTSGSAIGVSKVVHMYTGNEVAEKVAALSRNFADRRIYNVFPQSVTKLIGGDSVVIDGCFAAAAVAGLCSSTLPQQPLTNMAINGIDDVPETYMNYDNTQLNTMAEGGTFIIAQDLQYDQVYVRHQVSTAAYESNLLTRELSITKNVDSISYYLAESCKDLIGKYNVSPALIRLVNNRITTAITELERDTEDSLYGPQLLADGTEIVSIAEHPSLSDHVEAYIRISPPKPFNNLDIHLTVI